MRVKWKDIKKATKGVTKCPIARAFQRKGYTGVSVASDCVLGIKDSRWIKVLLPPHAQQFIKDFDAGLPVKPFKL